jgi:hypothetical protein
MGCNPPISPQELSICTNYGAQVEMEHSADQTGDEAGPWQADVEQSTAKCRGSDSVFVLATVVGKSLVRLGFVAFTNKQTPWSESAIELYLRSDRHLSAKLVPKFC